MVPPMSAAKPQPPVRAPGLARVVIVGRPNVGKSTLFNALAGRRVAIEDPMAGVTRDRVSFILDIEDKSVELIDTGGIGMVDDAQLEAEVDGQIDMALDLADLILFVVDVKNGLTALDHEVANRLRRMDRPLMLVANKVEAKADQLAVAEAHALGFGEPAVVSAKERLGIHDLREAVLERLGDVAVAPMMPSDVVALAIVGRTNVGKSTLVNTLVGDERVIVSEVAGTTRDAVDVPFTFENRRYNAIDTAGIRKKRTIADSVEFYGQARAERAIRRADVVWLMLDATRDTGRIDKQVAGFTEELCLPTILVVNKWDEAKLKASPDDYEDYVRATIPGMARAPIALLSALHGHGIPDLLRLSVELHEQAAQRVSTGELNRVLRRAYQERKPRPVKGRIGKVYYASQVATNPPTLAVFVNDPSLFEEGWRRFLVHRLQDSCPWSEVPVRLRLMRRSKERE